MSSSSAPSSATSSASSKSSSRSQTSTSECALTPYTFSLTPGTDLTTLDTGSGTMTRSASVVTSNSVNATSVPATSSGSPSTSGCSLTSYTFSLTPGTDLVTLDTGSGVGSDSPTTSADVTTGNVSLSSHTVATFASTGNGPLSSTLATKTTPAPVCLADGAPWYSPTSWCDCATSGTNSAFPTLPPSSDATDSSANCAYTFLDPAQIIKPVSVRPAPTNIPGINGIPGCAIVLQGDGQGCPNVDYCNCGGTYVDFLTATISGTTTRDCDVKFPRQSMELLLSDTNMVLVYNSAYGQQLPHQHRFCCLRVEGSRINPTHQNPDRCTRNPILQRPRQPSRCVVTRRSQRIRSTSHLFQSSHWCVLWSDLQRQLWLSLSHRPDDQLP